MERVTSFPPAHSLCTPFASRPPKFSHSCPHSPIPVALVGRQSPRTIRPASFDPPEGKPTRSSILGDIQSAACDTPGRFDIRPLHVVRPWLLHQTLYARTDATGFFPAAVSSGRVSYLQFHLPSSGMADLVDENAGTAPAAAPGENGASSSKARPGRAGEKQRVRASIACYSCRLRRSKVPLHSPIGMQ